MDVFPLPQHSYTKTSGYRTPDRPGHNGVDYGAPEGTALLAVVDGEVYVPGYEAGGAGNNLWLRNGDIWWKYFHCSHIVAKVGQQVRAGDVIAMVGHTGAVLPPGPDGAHLHIERHEGGPSNPTDPTAELDAAERHEHFALSHTAPVPEDEMTPDDRQWLEDQLIAHRNDLDERVRSVEADRDRNVLAVAANMARVNYAFTNMLNRRLGLPDLPPFTVNIDDLTDDYAPTGPGTVVLHDDQDPAVVDEGPVSAPQSPPEPYAAPNTPAEPAESFTGPVDDTSPVDDDVVADEPGSVEVVDPAPDDLDDHDHDVVDLTDDTPTHEGAP